MKHTNFFYALKTAFFGVRNLFMESRNARIQLIVFLIVLLIGFYVGLTAQEWLWIMGVSAAVISMEAINTSIELLADVYMLEYNEKIKQVKDIAAGAVLLVSLFAVVVGILVFLPHLSAMFPL
jgi:diacylglycerol kinase